MRRSFKALALASASWLAMATVSPIAASSVTLTGIGQAASSGGGGGPSFTCSFNCAQASFLLPLRDSGDDMETDGTGAVTYGPNNWLLDSATFIPQSVATEAESYIIAFNGTGTVTWTGSASGSLTGSGAGQSFIKIAAALGTLTFTTSGTTLEGRVEEVTYETSPRTLDQVDTGSQPYWGPRTDCPPDLTECGYLLEGQITTIALWGRDLSNSVWTKVNATIGHTTGIDTVANSASTFTATAANATVLQTISASNVTDSIPLYVKCITCTGAINITEDGATFTALTSSNCMSGQTPTAPNSSTWVRCSEQTTVTTPIIGLQLANSGDEIAVDAVNFVASSKVTSPIFNTSDTPTRTQDACTFGTAATTVLQSGNNTIVEETGDMQNLNSTIIGDSAGSQQIQTLNNVVIRSYSGGSTAINASLGAGQFAPGLVRGALASNTASSFRNLVGNGGSVSNDTFPGNYATTVSIGVLNGLLTQLKIYNTTESNATIISQTTLGNPW
jgi:hypothetical protein